MLQAVNAMKLKIKSLIQNNLLEEAFKIFL